MALEVPPKPQAPRARQRVVLIARLRTRHSPRTRGSLDSIPHRLWEVPMTDLMPTPEIERAAEGDDPIDDAELAAAAFLARYQAHVGGVPLRPAGVLPVGGR